MQDAYKNASSIPADFGLAQPLRKILVVLPGYAADRGRVGEGSALLTFAGLFWRSATSARYKAFVRQHRDFYANARSDAYMADTVGQMIAKAAPHASVTLLITAETTEAAWAQRVIAADGTDLLAKLPPSETFDAIVLAHHDAIGLGLFALERALLARGQPVVVINGRRRVYRLGPAAHRLLAPRRFLAQTRIGELLMGYNIDFLRYFLTRAGFKFNREL